MRYSKDTIAAARRLYLQRCTPKEIALELGLNSARVVYSWAKKHDWALMLSSEGTSQAIARRLELLLERDKKTDTELKELELLIEHQVSMARVEVDRLKATQESEHLERPCRSQSRKGPSDKASGHSKSQKSKQSGIGALTDEDFQKWIDSLWGYQKELIGEMDRRARAILKSRQIGFTYYFAGEALITALKTGKSQLFVSASRAQSEIFLTYIKKIAKAFWGIELKGQKKIKLPNGAELIALPSNARNIEGFSGDLYFDEFAWTNNFKRFQERASGMAAQTDRRRTYFSTPSIMAHESYVFWSGADWKQGDPEREHIAFPIDEQLRTQPQVCPDGIWRIVITVDDAIAKGCDKLDRAQLVNENSADAFKNKFLCHWVDDAEAVFRWSNLKKAIVNASLWKDVDFEAAHPYAGNVWIGYDPARSGDLASCVVVTEPRTATEKIRVLEVHRWRNMSWEYQSEAIRKLTQKYNVTHIGIDASGPGSGVYERVSKFFPLAMRFTYNNQVKTQLVLKAIQIINAKRLQWDATQQDIAPAFMAIRRDTTKGGKHITYVASRTATTGHADTFFAICHALAAESLTHDMDSGISIGVIE